jgi:hypothetical protein
MSQPASDAGGIGRCPYEPLPQSPGGLTSSTPSTCEIVNAASVGPTTYLVHEVHIPPPAPPLHRPGRRP